MRIGIIGSMQFTEKMLEVKEKLAALGHEAFVTDLHTPFIGKTDEEKEIIKIHQKNNLDAIREFWNKMQGADAVLVLNLDKHGIKNYIGGNTLMEIGFAHVLNQKIFLLNPIPEISYYKTEIEAVKPIIINGDLTLIKDMENPKVGVGVIIVKDNKVLMQKRINAHGNGSWSFPGGHLEFNEQPEECAIRESQEEFGITIKSPQIVAVTNDIFPKEKKQYVTIFVLSENFEGEVSIKEPDKCEQWSWFSWEHLPQPLFVPILNLLKQNFNPFDKLNPKKYQHYKGNFL